MSIPVALHDLRTEVDRFGHHPYLLTTGDDGRPHAVSSEVVWDGDTLLLHGGRRTVANATLRAAVALLWAPREHGGYSLIVDGTAQVDGTAVRVTVERAVLHRTGTATDPAAACGSDCVPLT